MKKILLVCLLVLTGKLILAQEADRRIDKKIPELDKFVGSWEFRDANQILTITLKKVI
jgi:hypothetical protein